MFSNKLCVGNSSYTKWRLDSCWQLNIPYYRMCTYSLGQKSSRFISKLKWHSLATFMAVCFFNVSPKWYQLFLFSAAVTINVWSAFWLNPNVVSYGYAVSPWRQNSLASCISNVLPSKSRLNNDVNSTFERSQLFRLLPTLTCIKIQSKPQHSQHSRFLSEFIGNSLYW